MQALVRLKQRVDFLRVAKTARKWVAPGLVLCAALTPGGAETVVRVGFTVSRKVGNAVKRNRARRRLRAVAVAVLPEETGPGYDLVLIGRVGTVERPYADLLADLRTAVRHLGLSQQGWKVGYSQRKVKNGSYLDERCLR